MCFKDFNYKNVYISDIKNICKFKLCDRKVTRNIKNNTTKN